MKFTRLEDMPTEAEIVDAHNWARDYCAREHATRIAIPAINDSQMNSIEAIWATNLVCADKIRDCLKKWGLYPGQEELRANAFVWIRLGPTNHTNII